MVASKPKEFERAARPVAEALIKHAKEEGAKYGITDVKVVISENTEREAEIERGHVARAVGGTTHKVTVTLYADDRSISFTKNTLGMTALKNAMNENMKVIHLAPENPSAALLEKEKVYTGPQSDLNLYDITEPSNETLINYAKEVEAAAMSVKGTKATRSVSMSKKNTHLLIMATNGVDIQESRTLYQASASVVAEDENGMQIDGEYSVARHFCDMAGAKDLGKRAGLNAVGKLGASLPDTGEYPIVLDNDAAESFFNSVFQAIDGTAIHQGASFLKGKLEQQIMSAEVTITDNPNLHRGVASRSVDTAGIKSEEITFVENGVLKSFNSNLAESRKLGIEPIGRENGRTNTRVQPGIETPDELISDIKEGIYIQGFQGGTVNVNNGTYSRQAYGKMIRDGKITDESVDGFIVSGNLKEMFMDISLADDTPPQPKSKHSLAAPTTRINRATIAGK
ncbi:MAG: TldD/PmbA family protein [Pseudomonadota bacterium]|nr:TldD/PmbA family protein [Pseudomonadota bacterium]QKK04397.1 MAG: TldD/PmbA family protein [Pseudomonadota bacterium]